jgi:hypothetical protein
MAIDARPLSAANPSRVEELRRTRDHGLRGMGDLSRLLGGHGTDIPTRADPGADQQRRWILESELRLGQHDLASPEPADQSPNRDPVGRNDRFGSRAALGHWGDHPSVPDQQWLAPGRVVPPARRCEEVYDILNCGPRHRFTVRGHAAPFIVSNCVQATARDVLCDTLVRIEKLGDLVLTIHDEIVVEIDDDVSAADIALAIQAELEKPPSFAVGLPVGSEGGIRSSYGV